MMEFITLVFKVEPVAKGRPRIARSGHAFTPSKTRKAESDIKTLAKLEMKKLKKEPFSAPVAVAIEFIMQKPKKPSQPYPSRSDLDNYAKLVCDALNEIVWDDDSQIVDLYLTKRWGEASQITVQVTPLKANLL
jgi:Holliday junction resolvase RusA-like endonuclease